MNKQKGDANLVAMVLLTLFVVIGWSLAHAIRDKECERGMFQVIKNVVYTCVKVNE